MESFDIRRLFTLEGRIDRSTFWFLTIVNRIVLLLILMAGIPAASLVLGLAFLILLAFILAMAIATPVKRWHDRGKSGWWIFIVLVPVIGELWALIETGFLPGDPGPNRYGPPNSGSPFGGANRPSTATVR